MGQQGKLLRQLANGDLPHFFQPVEPPFNLEEKMELDSPVEILDSLLFVAGVMLAQLILRAASRVLALASVTITLSLEGNGLHVRTVRPALPTNDRQLWIKLMHLDLDSRTHREDRWRGKCRQSSSARHASSTGSIPSRAIYSPDFRAKKYGHGSRLFYDAGASSC
jgi:hypothetical protein